MVLMNSENGTSGPCAGHGVVEVGEVPLVGSLHDPVERDEEVRYQLAHDLLLEMW